MYIYDYKFPDLSEIAYNHLLHHLDAYEVKPQFSSSTLTTRANRTAALPST